jgi:hypothetical protein
MGRPTSLTPEVQAAIIAAISAGNYRSTAAAAAGVHRNRMAEWEKRGESGEEPYASFACALQTAEAQAEVKLLAEIRSAQAGVPGVSGADLWQAKAWVMERRFASRWCARVKQQVAENVEALTSKLKADPELHRKVVDVLADQESAQGGTASH